MYAARILLTVFLLVGSLSFAAVLTMRLQLDCRDEDTVLTTETGVAPNDRRRTVFGHRAKAQTMLAGRQRPLVALA